MRNANGHYPVIGRRARVSLFCVVFIAIVSSRHANALALEPGDIVVSVNLGTGASPNPALVSVDPATGDRTIISDNSVGGGTSFVPTVPAGDDDSIVLPSVTVTSSGQLLVTEDAEVIPPAGPLTNVFRLFSVDPATGDRTLISDQNANSGPASQYIGAREFGSSILLSGSASMLTVDPLTGNRALFSGGAVGTGPQITLSYGFVQSGTHVFVADASSNQILGIDMLTANRAIVAGAGVGTGPTISNPNDLELDHAGNLLVSLSSGSILRVDPTTGDRTVVTSSTVGTGPIPSDYFQVGIASSGAIIAANNGANQLLTIDPISGDRTILADATHGTGPNLLNPVAVAIVPNVPEPSTIVLAALGSLALLMYRSRMGVTRAWYRPSGTPA